ncbi:hypothetical protein DPMN_061166 [Dreissena polymorpha]|uniref:Uncharacterized protein n=1 Tax=Dreissena polymorpha TaxID=45954 RepID=A0A9D4C7C0_DREPO|nr:hypothetical protein DPMN_061166 [Dreissena polymorpha]
MEVDENECDDADDLVVTRVYRAASFTNSVTADRMCVQGSRSATHAESQTAAGTSRRTKNLHERTRRPVSPETWAMSRERISSWNRDSENFAIPQSPEESDTGSEDYVSHVANRFIGKEQLDVQQTARPIRNVLRGTLKERLEGSGLHGLRRD